MISRFRTFIAGFLVLLPLAVTVAVIIWVGTFIFAYLGPDGAIGRILISIGFNFSSSPVAAYALGAVVVVGLVYLLGLVVESRLESRVRHLIDSLMQRIPFVGNLYDVTKRFVAIVDRKNQDGLKSMSPVWCFFGGEGGAAVLGVLPMPKPITIGEHQYYVVLVPSAPVPVGGCLVYVPVQWVKPVMAWRNEPMLPHVVRQGTDDHPSKELQRRCAASASRSDGAPGFRGGIRR